MTGSDNAGEILCNIDVFDGIDGFPRFECVSLNHRMDNPVTFSGVLSFFFHLVIDIASLCNCTSHM
jgi:hypothetical protein